MNINEMGVVSMLSMVSTPSIEWYGEYTIASKASIL